MRKALIIGIDDYREAPLYGCVKDARRIYDLLRTHENGDLNFHCQLLTSDRKDTKEIILRKNLEKLFQGDAALTLFYFSGHGALLSQRGYIAAQDSRKYREGIPMAQLIELANQAILQRRHQEIVIVLDCCYSGEVGNLNGMTETSIVAKGLSILTATQKDQEAIEDRNGGVFTSIICNAIKGGAADLLGKVTIASLFNYADQLLGPFEQRPSFKTNVSRMVSLRNCKAKIPLAILRKITTYFNKETDAYKLDPSFEPTSSNPSKVNGRIFKHLQLYNQYGLLRPYGLPERKDFMYFAAMESKGCRLTHIGRFYWRMAKQGMF